MYMNESSYTYTEDDITFTHCQNQKTLLGAWGIIPLLAFRHSKFKGFTKDHKHKRFFDHTPGFTHLILEDVNVEVGGDLVLVSLSLQVVSDGRHVEVVGATVAGTLTCVSVHENI